MTFTATGHRRIEEDEAGAELDARVAAAAGWRWPADRCGVCGWWHMDSTCLCGTRGRGVQRRADAAPQCSTSDAAAVETLVALTEERCWSFSLSGRFAAYSGGGYVCTIVGCPTAGAGPTLALAICAAILEACQ